MKPLPIKKKGKQYQNNVNKTINQFWKSLMIANYT